VRCSLNCGQIPLFLSPQKLPLYQRRVDLLTGLVRCGKLRFIDSDAARTSTTRAGPRGQGCPRTAILLIKSGGADALGGRTCQTRRGVSWGVCGSRCLSRSVLSCAPFSLDTLRQGELCTKPGSCCGILADARLIDYPDSAPSHRESEKHVCFGLLFVFVVSFAWPLVCLFAVEAKLLERSGNDRIPRLH
jgi:hypothetical protein